VSGGDAATDAAIGPATDGGTRDPLPPIEKDAGDPPPTGGGGAAFCATCDSSASCDPDAAQPRCVCPAGFEHEGDQLSACVDLDECDLGEDECSKDAECTNTEGSYECECDDGFEGDGEDCEDIDECDDDPCDDDASCTNTDGSYECECDDGFEGDGEFCDDIDECDDDPCDDDASCTNTKGSYECECDEPLVGNGKRCACDLTGTFAALAEIDVEWDEVAAPIGTDPLLSAGSDTTRSWSIRRLVQSGAEIEVEITPCGGTSSDLCSPYYDAAFGQFVPDATWDAPEMPTFESTWDLPDPDPDDDFVGPLEVALLGLDLDDAFDEWPSDHADSEITWLDHDGDDDDFSAVPSLPAGPLGVTTVMRLSGHSDACDMDYEGVPIPPLGSNRASHIMTGERSQARLDGKLLSCDVMAGKLGGPDTCKGEDNDDDVPCFDGRMRACVRTSGATCSTSERNAFDDSLNEPGTRILDARFIMERVDDDITCADVRAYDFPDFPED
jgi:hypothetical protein